MRLLVTADLHLDFWTHARRDPLATIQPVLDTLDALVIAGDLANNPLSNWPGALDRIGRLIDPARVHVLPGNHDYYLWHLRGDDRLRQMVEAAGMVWAQKAALEFGDIRLLCCTLWADFLLTGERQAAMRAAERGLNDYRLISKDPAGTLARPADTAALHRDHLAWLTAEITRPWAGKTVVVTHHGPSPCTTGPVDRLTPAFSSNLDNWILRHQPDLWLFGHTHRRLRGQVGQTPITNISLGYPDEAPAGAEADVLLRGLLDTQAPTLLAAEQEGHP